MKDRNPSSPQPDFNKLYGWLTSNALLIGKLAWKKENFEMKTSVRRVSHLIWYENCKTIANYLVGFMYQHFLGFLKPKSVFLQ